MRPVTRHLTPARLLGAIGLFLLAGGGAWAASSGGGHTIHGCFSKHGGALRVASRCRHGEKSLSWNQAGAAGANGAAGAPGAPGLRGPEGPSDLYVSGTAFEPLSNTKYFQAGLLTLPPGSYMLQAKATFFAKSSGTQMGCGLDIEQGATKTLLDEATATAGAGNANVLSLIGTAAPAAEAQVTLMCKLQGGSEGEIDDARLTALKVATVHGTLPVD